MTGSVSNSKATPHSSRTRRIVRSVIVGGLIGALISVFAAQFAQRTVFDTWQRLAPREISMDNVAVVLIDDVSVKDLGGWPWSRYLMARLIANINAANPAAIGIDIYFTEPDPLRPEAFAALYQDEELDLQTRSTLSALPQMDEVLAQTIAEGPTVLARFATEVDGKSADEVFFNSELGGEPPPKIIRRDQLVTSIAPIDDLAFSQAMVNGPPDSDGIVRRVPLGVQVGDVSAPGFAMELARVAAGEENLAWVNGAVQTDTARLPIDETGSLPFKMGYFPNPAIYPAAAVAKGQVPTEAFANKVVLVGVGATGTFDIVATPLRSEIYGVLVQAMAVDAILTQQWLTRPPLLIALEIVAALALAALVLLAGLTLRTLAMGASVAFAMAVPIASFLAYTQANLLFDPVRPLLIGSLAAIALALTRYAIARAERTCLAAELVEQRVIASQQEGELQAARRIQMSMVPSEQVLSKLDPRTDIGAVLQPAKSVGGDFYDAARVGEDQIIFVVGDVTGKGVPAALFMALSKSLAKSNLARPTQDLATAVCELNRDLMDEADEEMGLTLLVGILDCATGEVKMVNAGHENPLYIRKGAAIENIELRGGPPLCVIDFPYGVETITLAATDTLVVITDGATEASNAKDELFGIDGVIQALEDKRGESASSRVRHLAERVRLFEGECDPTDDLTIFALTYLGPKPPA